MNEYDQKSKAGSCSCSGANPAPDPRFSKRSHANNVMGIRSHLKVVLIDLEATREKRRVGYAAKIPRSDMRLIEKHLSQTSNKFAALMQELITPSMTNCC